MGYVLDISSVFAMLAFPVTYAVMSNFIDELPAHLSKILTHVIACLAFILALFAGIWLVYANNALEKNEDFSKNILIGMAIVLIIFVLSKILIQRHLKRTEYKLNYRILVAAIVSILVALPC
jgi:ABC-type phosphate transport system permease subunit